MRIDWKEKDDNAYHVVEDVLDKWCEYNNYYCDMMVLLKIDGVEWRAIAECDISGGWTWDWDWFEGGEIELLGFCPVEEVIIPEKYMLKD